MKSLRKRTINKKFDRPFLEYFKGYDIDPGPAPDTPPDPVGAQTRLLRGQERMEICKACDRYRTKLKVCKECNCVMPIKVLLNVGCPIGKW